MGKDLVGALAEVKQGAYVPHWTLADARYHIVFRLADSLPSVVVARWRAEHAELLAKRPQIRPELFEQRLGELLTSHVERYLDAGHGECWLRRPEIAQLVAGALLHRVGETHELHAWCVMPNHVHAVIRVLAPNALPALLQSWKGFTARAANRLLSRTGSFWQAEYFDRLLRDETEYIRAVRYVWRNPEAAGFADWQWRGASREASEYLELERAP